MSSEGEQVECVLRLLALGPTPHTLLIDGPSGSGKSTLATELVGSWPSGPWPVLVRMDDVYPGWHGLDAASEHVGEHLLTPRLRGESGRWQRYDWAAAESAGWHEVPAAASLIVEGCGSLSRTNGAAATARVWLDAALPFRRERALARDAGAFDPYWELWEEQFRRFVARERPKDRADLVLWSGPPER
ncbi:AAA family ATPase [Okibacterium endophyticum]